MTPQKGDTNDNTRIAKILNCNISITADLKMLHMYVYDLNRTVYIRDETIW